MTFPSGRTADALKVTHPSAIAWAAQMGTVTFHPGRSAARTPTTPTSCASTSTRSREPDSPRLAPSPSTSLKPLLDELGLVGYPKTSGGRGVHVFLRIRPDWDFVAVRRAGIALAREIERARRNW